ncbi:kinase-like domain-containing protein [Xylariaceae sp. FL0662B]|nr:kinase-like domain-containing protein [Xylariaceae sp. FL0662B]
MDFLQSDEMEELMNEEAETLQCEETVKAAKRYFTRRHKLEYQRQIGAGAYASALLFQQNDDAGNPLRKLVVKLAHTEKHEDALQNEIEILTDLRGCQHIGQIVTLSDWNPDPQTYSSGSRKDRAAAIKRQTMILEYVEHGDLQHLLQRVRRQRRMIPNRLLWRFFLCLTRACVAMAWGPNRDDEGDRIEGVHRETIPEEAEGSEPSTLRHSDMHSGNILIGGFDPDDPEHDDMAPVLKLIDFGVARYLEEDRRFGAEIGIMENVFDIGKIMQDLCMGKFCFVNRTTRDIPQAVVRDGKGKTMTINTHAREALMAPHVETPLKWLIARCLAARASVRPDLQELLETCEKAVGNRTAAVYRGLPVPGAALLETDRAVRRYVHEMIFEPDPLPTDPTGLALPPAGQLFIDDFPDDREGLIDQLFPRRLVPRRQSNIDIEARKRLRRLRRLRRKRAGSDENP